MLQLNKHPPPDKEGQGIRFLKGAELRFCMNVIHHQLPLFIALMTLSVMVGLVYLFTAVPAYTATASLMIDTRKAQSFERQPARNDIVVDAGLVQSQIEVLKSLNVSRAVIKQLHLTDDPEFLGSGPGYIGAIFNFVLDFFRSEEDPSDSRLMRRVLATFEGKRTVTRVAQSFVIEIKFQSTNREKAARIANAIAEAYIDDELEAKYDATRRASVWLQNRLKELRVQASEQQQAVVDFRQKNNIVDADGRLMNDQQISEVNSQLIVAQAATAEAKARYERIRKVMTQGVPDASIADALKNEIIVKLREKYLEMAARASIFARKYGPNHLSVVGLQAQMQEILVSIEDVMRKIEESYKSEYEIAQAREQSISNTLGNSVSQTQTTNQAQVQLRELESGAQTSRSLYDNFLQRYMDAVQQQSFPITEARIISPAETPWTKSYPKTTLTLLVTAAAGLAVSFGVASLRELLDGVFRSSEQVEVALQVACLGMLPRLKDMTPSNAEDLHCTETSPSSQFSTSGTRSRSMLNHFLEDPFSRFSEVLRAVNVASDLDSILKSTKVTGITSSLPAEGKSTIAANYAQLIAHAGGRTILVDVDLRNRTLSAQLTEPDAPGLVDVIAGWKTVEDVLIIDPKSGLTFMPAGGPKLRMFHSDKLLASEAMKKMIARLQETYDHVIVDLPPLIPLADARATTKFVDSYIFVVEWGCTRIDTVKYALSHAPELYHRLLGVLVNKVDMSTIGRYERYLGRYNYNKYYAQYSNSDQSAALLHGKFPVRSLGFIAQIKRFSWRNGRNPGDPEF